MTGDTLALDVVHANVGLLARTFMEAQKTRVGLGNRIKARERDGIDPSLGAMHVAATAWGAMEAIEGELERAIKRELKGHFMADWIETVPGISLPMFGKLLGYTGPLDMFPTPSHLWAYCGMAVTPAGTAPKRHKGVTVVPKSKGGDPRGASFSVDAKTTCYLIGWGFVKVNRGPYRAAYDRAKAEYLGDAGNHVRRGPSNCPFGQTHYAKRSTKTIECGLAHADAAARRKAVKDFLRDLWSEWHRRRPVDPCAPIDWMSSPVPSAESATVPVNTQERVADSADALSRADQ